MLPIVALEPEAILGVSFQLSFAAVGALVAVMEARLARARPRASIRSCPRAGARRSRGALWSHFVDKPLGLLLATALRDQRDRLVHGLSFP